MKIYNVKTYSVKPSQIQKKWWVIDARNLVLGRLASELAKILRGKHKPSFTPHLDCGDYVIIINAKHIYLTGRKSNLKNGKIYYRHTGFPGGIRHITAGKILSGEHPERVVKLSVKRMISRNTLGLKQMSNLYVYAENTHPHEAQQPEFYDFASKNVKNSKL